MKTKRNFHFGDVYKMGALKAAGLPFQTDERLRRAGVLHRVALSHSNLDISHLGCAKPQQIQDGVLVVSQNDVSLTTDTGEALRPAFMSTEVNVECLLTLSYSSIIKWYAASSEPNWMSTILSFPSCFTWVSRRVFRCLRHYRHKVIFCRIVYN